MNIEINALEVSINKYKKFATATTLPDIDIKTMYNDCELCIEYIDENKCTNCPIKKHFGGTMCQQWPAFIDFANTFGAWRDGDLKSAELRAANNESCLKMATDMELLLEKAKNK